MENVSIFKNFAHLIENKALNDIIYDIQAGKYQNEIEVIRTLFAEDKPKEADKLKKQLPAFTPSGIFNNGRKIDLLSSYSGFLVLDLDKLNPTQLEEVKLKATEIVFTYAAFVSPSGNGLKIIIPINNTAKNHKLAFQQVATHYANELRLEIDPSGKDVSRLCFMSFDPDCYFNPNAETFEINCNNEETSPVKQTNTVCKSNGNSKSFKLSCNAQSWSDKFDECVGFTEKKATYLDGSRNNFVHLLACNCNRIGMPESIAQNYILNQYNLDHSETTSTIASAYKNNIHEHAKFANLANSNDVRIPQGVNIEIEPTQSKDELLMNMPFLPDEIFDRLPEILRTGCSVFQDRRERDVFLTGALGILSGCMPNVVGVYRGKEHYANLYVFIIAPAASGKGSLTFSKELGQKYHDKLLAASSDKRKIYDVAIQDYKKKMNDKRYKSDDLTMPEEPPFKVLYIPANNSSARVIQHLKEGDEQGIFCETEADSMGNVLKQDWGSYSDLLRKAFHHEPISYSRKTGKEFVEIKKPRLAVALAGTPGQVQNLIKSAEDGLFSRFIFYSFKSEIEWVDASDTINGFNLTEHFENLSVQVLNFVEFLETCPKIHFKLTLEQWQKLNEFGKSSISTLTTFVSEDLASTSKRLGLILFRLCMVITTLKYFDRGEASNEFTCSDEDFEIALLLINTFQQHAVFMFNELPKSTTGADKALKRFYDLLPDNFQRKEAIELALNRLQIKERTADGYLSKLLTNKLLDNPRSGQYEKIKK